MQIVTKKVDAANVVANGSISSADLEQREGKIALRLSKSIKLDGFRKGKVPINLVRSRYKEAIEQDAQKEAVKEMLDLSTKEIGVPANRVIGDPVVVRFEKKEGFFDVEIKISLIPDIPIENVDSCIPEFSLIPVKDEEVKERLETIALSQSPLVDVESGRKLEKGCIAIFDFEGFVEGKPFDGGKAENFQLTIGSGHFISGFEEGMLGLGIGEEKDIEVVFPKDYHIDFLAGKPALFKVKLHAIKVKEKIPLDDNLAKKLFPDNKDANLNYLKLEVTKELEIEQKDKIYNEKLKNKLVENLIEGIDFDLPDLIVEQEMDILFRNALSKMSQEEIRALSSDASKAREQRESFRDEARKSVKITFIVDALAKEHGVVVEDNEVFQAIYQEALASRREPKEVLEHYRNHNLLPAIKMAMVEDRMLTYLLDRKLGEKEPSNSQSSSKES